jgi:hypothetical protein
MDKNPPCATVASWVVEKLLGAGHAEAQNKSGFPKESRLPLLGQRPGQKVKCMDISTMRPLPMVSVTTPSLLLDAPGTV